ncbi:hypothetical protein WMY93_017754 [Mugilogobius chulae]|uniref:VWFA domain-containing protein n=1 Tax=Mugilogobius chulae TaxID=88201 RepID=A0AAW0P072_9GOBI
METVHVLVSTSSELRTLPSGGIKVCSPPVCTPRVQRSINEEQGLSPNFSRIRERQTSASSPHDPMPGCPPQSLALLLEEETINSMDYEFNFQLEIRAPYLLAGVESPSHAIRADADPLARSATSVVITLADKYTYDCPVTILIYPSEPHQPHVLLESGDMTQEEYDEFLHGRNDFIKATKKDSSNEKKVEVIRKRLHKDILHNPVVMLNFCPDLKSVCADLRKVHGEFVFLIDRSGSMSGVNINRVKDAMMSLFSTSQSYEEDSLALACEYIKKIRADMGGTNILAPLSWILRQPMCRSHPRLLFLLTDGAVSNTGKVIEMVRSHARYVRRVFNILSISYNITMAVFRVSERKEPQNKQKCFTFGIGQSACRRLVQGVATVSRGAAEFLSDGERLQPKALAEEQEHWSETGVRQMTVSAGEQVDSMIKSLKKTMSPVLSDISIEWLFPETKEVLLSPVGSTFLFPGDSLIGYCVVCDTTRYHDNPKSDKRRRYSMMRSTESASSVFYHSQEEDPAKTSTDGSIERLRPAKTQGQSSALSPLTWTLQVWMIRRHHGDEPTAQTRLLTLTRQAEHETQWKNEYQPQLASLCASSSRGHTASCHLPSAHQGPEANGSPTEEPPDPASSAQPPPCVSGAEEGSRSSTDSPSVGSVGETDVYSHQLCQAETPQDVLPDSISPKADCKAVVSGLLCGTPVKWEVEFDIEPYLNGREREEKVHEELWNENFHYLAGRSIINDFEHMADKECEIEHGSGRRYQSYAVHSSKSCNILSKFTAFVPIDLDTNEYLPTCIEHINHGEVLKRSSRSSSRSSSRKNRIYSIGLGRSQSGGMSEDAEDGPQFNGNIRRLVRRRRALSVQHAFVHMGKMQLCRSVPAESVCDLGPVTEISGEPFLSQTGPESDTPPDQSRQRIHVSTHSKSGDSIGDGDNENKDYIPLVSLQLASGAFPLDSCLCEAVSVPMEKLKWTSPFSSHRSSLSRRAESLEEERRAELDSCVQPTDRSVQSPSSASISLAEVSCSLGSPSAPAELPLSPMSQDRGSQKEGQDVESMVWATAVALAWLEHSSASFFIEWELVAAKASLWLEAQDVPEGKDLASVKAAANQLFIILRHWDENLHFNMLCYHPDSV